MALPPLSRHLGRGGGSAIEVKNGHTCQRIAQADDHLPVAAPGKGSAGRCSKLPVRHRSSGLYQDTVPSPRELPSFSEAAFFISRSPGRVWLRNGQRRETEAVLTCASQSAVAEQVAPEKHTGLVREPRCLGRESCSQMLVGREVVS